MLSQSHDAVTALVEGSSPRCWCHSFALLGFPALLLQTEPPALPLRREEASSFLILVGLLFLLGRSLQAAMWLM